MKAPEIKTPTQFLIEKIAGYQINGLFSLGTLPASNIADISVVMLEYANYLHLNNAHIEITLV